MPHATKGKRSAALAIEYIKRASLIPDPGNARKHSKKQLVRLEAAIGEFGFTVPILIDNDLRVIAGHARLLAAEALGMDSVPCVRLGHLSAAQKRALAIADNRIAELAEWDPEALRAEFSALCELEFPLELTGFETAEIDLILDYTGALDPADVVDAPNRSSPPVSRRADCWSMESHRLYCGDALAAVSYEALLDNEQAAMIITDPPYNLAIQGHVSGLGKTTHAEFAMASGEMSKAAFTAFLKDVIDLLVRYSTDGSIHFIFMDWRHIGELTMAAAQAYAELKALCIWNKSNGGMGSLYRSKHELVFVYKNGTARHQNNIQLGKHGRYRTNVWDYAGTNTFGRSREADLAAHPTVKPVALIADAIRDCSKRGDLILDPFAGSGTIILAAERTGRTAVAIELDPHYVDTAVRRWQQWTGKCAILAGTQNRFDDVAADRTDTTDPASLLTTSGGNER
jgi:DNA modification methylase